MTTAEWDGATLRTTYKGHYQALRDEFANLARDDDWPALLGRLAEGAPFVNTWRPGRVELVHAGPQAALHGADASVVTRLPELDVLTELETPDLWFGVPGMYGGFRCVLEGLELKVDSWIRVVGGSGETHRITVGPAVLTNRGFV